MVKTATAKFRGENIGLDAQHRTRPPRRWDMKEVRLSWLEPHCDISQDQEPGFQEAPYTTNMDHGHRF